ncbi:hypothetical protein DSO57_1022595 [Entomophthora muscae]|uniref:Uncharacterized protein n=1 Tax=Entomophthora muscae TaxID=34485 RepID=A0ACC2UC45_9FUNG|nr:hypothetical protein DSO57_1022595 [Entomophthora muscae]
MGADRGMEDEQGPVYSEAEYEIFDMLPGIAMCFNVVSMIAAAFVVVVIVGAMAIDKRSMDRVSIRITLAISVLDFFRSLGNILSGDQYRAGWRCIVVSSMIGWTSLGYLFLSMCIAFNLQLIFINGIAFNPIWERMYWIISFGLATAINMIPIGGFIVGNANLHDCADGDRFYTNLLEWCLYLIWILVACIYCSFVVAIVIYKLAKSERKLGQVLSYSTNTEGWNTAKHNPVIKGLVRRVALYCIIPIVTHVFYLFYAIDDHIHGYPSTCLILLATISTGLPGTLNLFAFLVDPAFAKAVDSFRMLKAYHMRFPANNTTPLDHDQRQSESTFCEEQVMPTCEIYSPRNTDHQASNNSPPAPASLSTGCDVLVSLCCTTDASSIITSATEEQIIAEYTRAL